MIIISEKINLDVDTTEADRKIKALDEKIEESGDKLENMADSIEDQTKKSYMEVMGMMRASYMMVTGISQLTGGTMGQVFSSLYGITVATIGTYKSIAAAIAASGPQGWVQAGLMYASLMTSTIQLGAVAQGQTDLSRRIGGLNTALQGFGGMIDSFSI